MYKKILLISLFSIELVFGQTKLQNENIERNKLKLRYITSIDYLVKAHFTPNEIIDKIKTNLKE